MMRGVLRAMLALGVMLTTACGPEELLPIPRFDVTPEILCEGTTAQALAVDARRSLGRDAMPSELLAYRWEIVPPPRRWLEGGTDDREATAEVDVQGPITVNLTVTDELGGSAVHSRVLTITRTTPTLCGAGCAAGELCVQVDGDDVCVDDLTCTSDDACGPCLACRDDDDGVGRCMGPRS